MLIEGDKLAEFLHLQEFAFNHLLREFDEGVEDSEIALLHCDFECLHVKPVARENALRVSPLGVCRGTPSASLGLIDDVVVNERGSVNDFDDGPQLHCAASLVVKKFR